MAEAMFQLNSMMLLADICVPLSFVAVFVVIQFIVDSINPPYCTYENGMFTVFIYLASKNRSNYHEYYFVRTVTGGLRYVPQRSRLIQALFPAVILIVSYVYLVLKGRIGSGLYVHFAIYFIAFYFVVSFFHPVWAWIFLKRQGN